MEGDTWDQLADFVSHGPAVTPQTSCATSGATHRIKCKSIQSMCDAGPRSFGPPSRNMSCVTWGWGGSHATGPLRMAWWTLSPSPIARHPPSLTHQPSAITPHASRLAPHASWRACNITTGVQHHAPRTLWHRCNATPQRSSRRSGCTADCSDRYRPVDPQAKLRTPRSHWLRRAGRGGTPGSMHDRQKFSGFFFSPSTC